MLGAKKGQLIRISWGPQHPITGWLRFVLEIDGDKIVNAIPDIGQTHRGIEKISEYRTYYNFLPVMEKVCIFDPSHYVLPFCQAAEQVIGIEVPERANYLRVIACEISRLMSHLYMMTLYAMSTGMLTPMMWCIGDRELILDLGEMLTGARVAHLYIIPGGVRNDMPEGFARRALENLEYFERRLKVYEEFIFNNKIFQQRTKGVGVVDKNKALDLGITGPNARASGIDIDMRRDDPYAAYDKVEFDVPVEDDGDCYARGLVRLREMEQSVRIMRQAIKDMPKGDYKARVSVFAKARDREAFSHVETARGELGIYLKGDGTDRPYRCKIMSPSFRNLYGMAEATKGARVADISVIYQSFDIILLDVDR